MLRKAISIPNVGVDQLQDGQSIRVLPVAGVSKVMPSLYVTALLEIHSMIDFTADTLGVKLEQLTWDSSGIVDPHKTHIKIQLATRDTQRQFEILTQDVLNLGDLKVCKKISRLIEQELTRLATT